MRVKDLSTPAFLAIVAGAVFGVVSLTALLWVGYDIWSDRRHNIEIVGDTPLFDEACNRKSTNTAVKLHAGAQVKVTRIYYEKDQADIYVSLPDGRRGCLVAGVGHFAIHPRLP